MQVSEPNNSSEEVNKQFITRLYNSKEEFASEYKKLYHEKAKAEELYILILTKLKNALLEGNFESFKKLSNLIDYTNDIEDQVVLGDYYDNANNPIRNTNLVILACKHNKVNILEYLLDTFDGRILNKLSVGNRRTILPEDKDEALHNAFYYAIRSGNSKLLNTIINKWPDNYFAFHLEELDEFLSRAYEELQLQNMPLPNEIEIFVQNKLITLFSSFYIHTSGRNQNSRDDLREQIDLIVKDINLLKSKYAHSKKVDKTFLLEVKFIAQFISSLKRQLRSTYDRLPWEEIEFCLLIFVSSYTKRKINLIYKAILPKTKLLNHLENFVIQLENVKHIVQGVHMDELAVLPQVSRDKVIEKITSNFPQFEELYNDYQQLRDIHSLEKISEYVKLASCVDSKKRDEQLIITRVLQVIGEHLKNTLESPKSSNFMNEYFLLLLPKNIKEIIVDIRNSVSHSDSLSKRLEIEENTNVQFYINIQNDTKNVGVAITDILYNNKIKIVRKLLENVINSKNTDEIMEVTKLLSAIDLEKINFETFKMMDHANLKKYIKDFSDNIEKTNFEKQLFDQISSIINEITQSENIKTGYVTGVTSLKKLNICWSVNMIDHNTITMIKIRVGKILDMITSKIEPRKFKEISEHLRDIFRTASLRVEYDQFIELKRLFSQIIICNTDFGTDDLIWIHEL